LFTRVTFRACLLAFLAPGMGCGAAEQLLFEDFEKFNLQQLPAGWTLENAADLSIVDEPGHGKVLKISQKGGGWARLSAALDAAKVSGHVVRISALAKFPGSYAPLADKPWARPKILLTFKDKEGKDQFEGFELEPNKPEWQPVSKFRMIDKDAQAAAASLRIDLVAAEVFFDDFCVELDPDLKSPPPRAKAAGDTAAAPATPAQKSPGKTLDTGGALFNPEIAAAMQKAVKPRGSYTYLVAGPGLPLKEFEAAPPEKWTHLPGGKELSGAAATPRNLLAALPLSVSALKPEQWPEVIFLVGEATPTRKTTMLEALDWQDLTALCLRLGAVPVLAVPAPAPAKDGPITMVEDQRATMLRAAAELNCPAVDLNLKDPKQLSRLVRQMITLLDKHVFCRTPLEQAGGTRPDGKKIEEE